jgi:homoserine O-acetyltransferase/O-succinyltransferase
MNGREVGRFAAGDVVLDGGQTLPDVELVYATYGTLAPARDNVIVYPTRFGGTHEDNEFLIGPERALDTTRFFVVVPNLLGNGVSTSPSNAGRVFGAARFPLVTIADNVRLQHRLVREVFDARRVRLAVGWSMGGQQAYHWAALYPELVERLAVVCGAARTAPHTHVFLEGMLAALCADPDWPGDDGRPPGRGLRALGRAWAGWALSQAWYRRRGWEELGYSSVEDFLVRYWEGLYLARDAGNLVAMIRTWQACDLAAAGPFGGDFAAAMGAITAPAVIMPGRTDLYFPPEDAELEVALLREGRLATIPSDWGHYAGGGRDPRDTAFIEEQLRELLAR